MIYVFIGLVVMFVWFTVWAVVKANDFKSKPKEEKKEAAPPPPPQTDEYVFVTQEKPKKVKIKKKEKEEKVKGEAQVVSVFKSTEKADEEKPATDDREELYQKYIAQENGAEGDMESGADGSGARGDAGVRRPQPLPLLDRDIERRIAQIRRDNFEATDKPQSDGESFKDEPTYYGFGVGSSAHDHGSMKDPNFDPWANENKAAPLSPRGAGLSRRDYGDLLDDDDDFVDFEAIDRIMNNRPHMGPGSRPRPSGFGMRDFDRPSLSIPEIDLAERPMQSRVGGGSVKSQLSGKSLGESIVVGQAIGNRKVDDFDTSGTDGKK